MGTFENGASSYSCGRAKTEVFKYDDVMPRFKARSSAHTIRKRYVWTQIFLNTEKKISVFENTRLRVDSQIRFKIAMCGRRYFLNTEEKLSVFENTRLRVDEQQTYSPIIKFLQKRGQSSNYFCFCLHNHRF